LVANAHFLQKFIESFVQFRAMLCAFSIVGLLGILMAGIWSQTLPFITGQQTQAEYFAAFQGGEFNAEESLLVAEFLRQRVAPGDSLYIWGFRPEIYFLSDLYPATRFIFQFPLVGDWYPQ